MDEGYLHWLMADAFGLEADDRPAVPAWYSRAACATADPSAFFLVKGQTPTAARAMCDRCPVAEECLQLALEEDHTHGVWGGLTPSERAKLARQAA